MTDFISTTSSIINTTDYSSAFPPLKKNSWSISCISLSNHLSIFKSLRPPKYPKYLKYTNYGLLVEEQYQHLQNKRKLNEYNKELEEVDLRLPEDWNKSDKSRFIEIHGLNLINISTQPFQSGQEKKDNNISLIQKFTEPASIRTKFPSRPQCGIYYFEIKIMSMGFDGLFTIGLSTLNSKLNQLPGISSESFGYHGQDGMAYFDGKPIPYGPTFSLGDIVGCGIDYSNHTIFFTKNGIHLGIAFNSFKSSIDYYPTVGLGSPNEKISTNFGQDQFKFDIIQYIKNKQNELSEKINKNKPSYDQSLSIDQLILSYLAHQGYAETTKAFLKNIQYVKGTQPSYDSQNTQASNDALRIKIRKSVMSGSIDEVIEQLEAIYPELLNSNPDILFKLRVRKFLDIFICHRYPHDKTEKEGVQRRRNSSVGSYESHHASPPVVASGRRLSWAAVAAAPEEDQTQKKRLYSGTRRASSGLMDEEQNHEEAVKYGQELQQKYQHSPYYLDQLMHMFELLSYSDPMSCPLGYLLDLSHRDTMASDLNDLIQAHQNQNQISNLEGIYKQSVVTNKELALSGHGPSSLIPISKISF